MPVQILPIIKTLAPYVAQVATAAIPHFTLKPKSAKADPLVSQQIEELQKAAKQNAESIHVLADNLQKAMLEAESAAQQARAQIRKYKYLLVVSLLMSAASMTACAYLIAR